MQQVFAVEQDQQEADEKRSGDINEKCRGRKSSIVMFVNSNGNKVTDQRTESAASENEKTSYEQWPILARLATLSA